MKLSVTSSGRAGGSEAFLPGPADPEIDTRACEPRSGEKNHTRNWTLFSPRYTLRGAWLHACGWWVGGWPKVCVSWLLTPLDWSANAENKSAR